MEIHIAKDGKQLSTDLAAWIAKYIHKVLATKDRFTFVLSGGSTPKSLYALLSDLPYSTSIPWEKIHFFWGDERAVPFDDERNNARMCYQELLVKVAVRPENIHVMRTDISPEESAVAYDAILDDYFKDSETSFDLVLLGMGDDAHTLSLFPGTAVIHENERNTDAFFLPAQDMYRITLTARIVNRSACVVFMAVGSGKAESLKNVLEGERNVDQFPSQIIDPVKGQLHWFVDEAAAALLNR